MKHTKRTLPTQHATQHPTHPFHVKSPLDLELMVLELRHDGLLADLPPLHFDVELLLELLQHLRQDLILLLCSNG
jgi:hypothetical protein